jgi:hypothetical protein
MLQQGPFATPKKNMPDTRQLLHTSGLADSCEDLLQFSVSIFLALVTHKARSDVLRGGLVSSFVFWDTMPSQCSTVPLAYSLTKRRYLYTKLHTMPSQWSTVPLAYPLTNRRYLYNKLHGVTCRKTDIFWLSQRALGWRERNDNGDEYIFTFAICFDLPQAARYTKHRSMRRVRFQFSFYLYVFCQWSICRYVYILTVIHSNVLYVFSPPMRSFIICIPQPILFGW